MQFIKDWIAILTSPEKPEINVRIDPVQKNTAEETASQDELWKYVSDRALEKLKAEKERRSLPVKFQLLLGLAWLDGYRQPQEAIQLGLRLNALMDADIYTAMAGKTLLEYKHQDQYVIDHKGPAHVANAWRLTRKGLETVCAEIGANVPNAFD
ncbi:hypothetical protein JXA32_03595 [Candidatus Sumerlaeota bacterium]|nr:hypothetical protein [Candidatus Sumerlaeota bacterium]